jgi:hypothetical protein
MTRSLEYTIYRIRALVPQYIFNVTFTDKISVWGCGGGRRENHLWSIAKYA